VITNKKFWNSLPNKIQAQLTTAMDETTKYANMIAEQQNRSALAAIRNSGKTTVIKLTKQEKALWLKTLRPIKTQMENRIGKELIHEIDEALAHEGVHGY
jgi:C4-dicarboxylate-binding protein DctP